MKIDVGKWSFRPGLITSLLALAFFILFIRLGVWQLDRAAYKADLYSAFIERQQQPAVELESWRPGTPVEDMTWKPVVATGQFDQSKQVLLDNRVIKGKTGYFVYTPFELANDTGTVLVNRGWVAAPNRRDELPALKQSPGTIRLSGILKAEPRTGVMLADVQPESMQQGVYRVQEIDLQQLSKVLDQELLPVILRLDTESPYGYGTEWSLPGSDEQMHRGYAYQWFAFAATLLVIYLVVNTKRRKNNER